MPPCCDAYFHRMQRFYAQHNPAQLSQVDSILKKYAGKHELLFRSLHKKYEVDLDPLEVCSLICAHFDDAALIIPGFENPHITLLLQRTNSLCGSGGIRKCSLWILDPFKSIEAQKALRENQHPSAIVIVYVLLKYQELMSQPNQPGVFCSVFSFRFSLSLSL